MAMILILNGSPRKNGKTASLINAFTEGAESSGNEVKELYLQGMNITGQLKIVIDRLYAVLFGAHIVKEFVVIMTARGNMYEMTEDFFSIFTRFLGWKNLGNVLGAGKEGEARSLGESIA